MSDLFRYGHDTGPEIHTSSLNFLLLHLHWEEWGVRPHEPSQREEPGRRRIWEVLMKPGRFGQ